MSEQAHAQVSEATTNAAAIGWSEWLDMWRWTHNATISFSRPLSDRAPMLLLREWIHRLGLQAGRPVSWFVAIDDGSMGRPHLRVLLNAPLTLKEIADARQREGIEVAPNDDQKGTIDFCAGAFSGGTVDIDFEMVDCPGEWAPSLWQHFHPEEACELALDRTSSIPNLQESISEPPRVRVQP